MAAVKLIIEHTTATQNTAHKHNKRELLKHKHNKKELLKNTNKIELLKHKHK